MEEARRHSTRGSASPLHAVAIAGGSGTRLWPLSRRARPKPLLPSSDGATLLASTFERVRALIPPERWWMVVGPDHAEACRQAAPEVPAAHGLVEPSGRNTLPAIILAAAHLRRSDRGAVLVVLPADHHVRDREAFTAALAEAAQAARAGAIATLGITPQRPETGYGYIEVGEVDPRGGRRAVAFHEKPDRATAERYVASDRFWWNGGIFVLRPDALADELRRQSPEHAAAFERITEALGTPRCEDVLRDAFEGMPAISIDYGVMEHARDVVVVPADCGWSDLGDVAALAELFAGQRGGARTGDDAHRDADGNVLRGAAVTVDARDCLVVDADVDGGAGDHLVALLGVEGLAVVHTRDATLVMPVHRAQEVRAVVAQLEERGWDRWR